MSHNVDVRRAVAEYLAGQMTLDALHDLVVCAFAESSVDEPANDVIHQAYGLLTDVHSGLRSEPELRESLLPIVTFYSLEWALMGSVAQTVTGTATRFTPQSPVQRPSLRVFDRPHEAVSA